MDHEISRESVLELDDTERFITWIEEGNKISDWDSYLALTLTMRSKKFQGQKFFLEKDKE